MELKKSKFDAELHDSKSKYAESTHKIPEIMSHEARIAKVYFEYLRIVFSKVAPQFSFESRANLVYTGADHASDKINALLNYGHSILSSEIKKFLNSVGLDSQIGFLSILTKRRISNYYFHVFVLKYYSQFLF
jgi:CRISPR/Cas system-associated endonuclease Cas1